MRAKDSSIDPFSCVLYEKKNQLERPLVYQNGLKRGSETNRKRD